MVAERRLDSGTIFACPVEALLCFSARPDEGTLRMAMGSGIRLGKFRAIATRIDPIANRMKGRF
jgi:hypothetical protein